MHYSRTPSIYAHRVSVMITMAQLRIHHAPWSCFMCSGQSIAMDATVFQQTHHFQSLFSMKITKNDRVPCALEVVVHFYVFFRIPSHTPVGLWVARSQNSPYSCAHNFILNSVHNPSTRREKYEETQTIKLDVCTTLVDATLCEHKILTTSIRWHLIISWQQKKNKSVVIDECSKENKYKISSSSF